MRFRVGDEEQPVVGDAEPEFVSSLERLYVTLARFGEAVQSGQNTHGRALVEAADVSPGCFRPNDPLHRALL